MFKLWVFVVAYTAVCVAGTYNVRLVDDDVYDILINPVDRGVSIPFSRHNPTERRVFDLQQIFHFSLKERFNMVTGGMERMKTCSVPYVQIFF